MALIEREAALKVLEAWPQLLEKLGVTLSPQANDMLTDCIRAIRGVKAIDPVHAAGGCYCRDCKRYGPGPFGYGCHTMFDGKAAVIPHEPDHFCGGGEPKEAHP